MTTIKITDETKIKLKKIGIMGETYDDVINRLIDFYEAHKK